MKIPQEIAESVINGSMEELYNIFITLEGEYDKDFGEDYDLVRFGKLIKFEIQDLWEGTNSIVYKSKSNKVLIHREEYPLSDFRTEKEKRRKIMAEAIMRNMETRSIYKPRGGNGKE